MARAEAKLDRVETFEKTKELIDHNVEVLNEEINDRHAKITKLLTRKFDELYKTHLYRERKIGEDRDSMSKTLIDYVLNKFPKYDS